MIHRHLVNHLSHLYHDHFQLCIQNRLNFQRQADPQAKLYLVRVSLVSCQHLDFEKGIPYFPGLCSAAGDKIGKICKFCRNVCEFSAAEKKHGGGSAALSFVVFLLHSVIQFVKKQKI